MINVTNQVVSGHRAADPRLLFSGGNSRHWNAGLPAGQAHVLVDGQDAGKSTSSVGIDGLNSLRMDFVTDYLPSVRKFKYSFPSNNGTKVRGTPSGFTPAEDPLRLAGHPQLLAGPPPGIKALMLVG